MVTEHMAAAERADAPITVIGALELARQLYGNKVDQLHDIIDEKQEQVGGLIEELEDLRSQLRAQDEDETDTVRLLRVQTIEQQRELTAEQTRRRKAEAAVVEVRAALAEYRACQLDGRQTIHLIDTITKDT